MPLLEVILDIGDGGTPNTNNREYFGHEVPWVVIQDIQREIAKTRHGLSSHAWNMKMKSPHKRKLANISGLQLCWKNGVAGAVERSGHPAHSSLDPDAVINPCYAAGLPRTFSKIQSRLLGDHALRWTRKIYEWCF